jgi:hypothetical protein
MSMVKSTSKPHSRPSCFLIAATVPRFMSLRLPCIGRIARRPRRKTYKCPPFAGSKVAPCRSSHRLNSALVTKVNTYVHQGQGKPVRAGAFLDLRPRPAAWPDRLAQIVRQPFRICSLRKADRQVSSARKSKRSGNRIAGPLVSRTAAGRNGINPRTHRQWREVCFTGR